MSFDYLTTLVAFSLSLCTVLDCETAADLLPVAASGAMVWGIFGSCILARDAGPLKLWLWRVPCSYWPKLLGGDGVGDLPLGGTVNGVRVEEGCGAPSLGWDNRTNTSRVQPRCSQAQSLKMVYPPARPYSSLTHSKMLSAVWRCFLGTWRSASRMRSMTAV